jgi:rhodanese-related sulfurtransferase
MIADMGESEQLKEVARVRGQQLGLPYSGALLPQEAYALMQAGAILVDVRTQAELYWVGRVPGSVFVEWNSYPQGQLNPDFLSQLAALAAKDAPVMFLCRSGGRSHNAALLATRAGWRECYNVLEGFEGDRDASQQRSTLGGWKRAGLPWVQS